VMEANSPTNYLVNGGREAFGEDPVDASGDGTETIVDDDGMIVNSLALPPPLPIPLSSNEHRRIKVCLVCGGQAETYHLNYGASACLSCRAFFR